MKTLSYKQKAQTMLVILFGIGVSLSAQTSMQNSTARIAQGLRNYTMGIRSGNAGVTESSLMYIMHLKVQNPDLEMGEAARVIDSLTIHAEARSIRYKAMLALQVCLEPHLYTDIALWNNDTTQDFYFRLSQRIQKKLLGMNDRVNVQY